MFFVHIYLLTYMKLQKALAPLPNIRLEGLATWIPLIIGSHLLARPRRARIYVPNTAQPPITSLLIIIHFSPPSQLSFSLAQLLAVCMDRQIPLPMMSPIHKTPPSLCLSLLHTHIYMPFPYFIIGFFFSFDLLFLPWNPNIALVVVVLFRQEALL